MISRQITLFEGIKYLESCDSTNQWVLNRSAEQETSASGVIYTFNQTKGRGQRGNNWFTGQGKDLALSFFVLLEQFHARRQFELNICLTLAVSDLVKALGSQVSIKWPNDIYFEDKKLAGILIQGVIQGEKMTQAVCGVGLNVNSIHFPKELFNPTSLYEILGKEIKLTKLPFLLKQMFIQRLERSISTNYSDYLSQLYRLKRSAHFLIEGKQQLAQIKGVSIEGKLALELNGELKYFNFKELEYVI